MTAHKLTIRPLPGPPDADGWPSGSDCEVLLDGKQLDGVTRIEFEPMDAHGGFVQVRLHMCVSPDFELPVSVEVAEPKGQAPFGSLLRVIRFYKEQARDRDNRRGNGV